MKKLLSFIIMVVFAAMMTVSAFAANYQLSDNQPADYPTTLGDLEFAKLVKSRTNGRIVIDVYHSAQLFDEKSAIETAQMGGLAFTRVNAQPLSDFTPVLGVLSLPYIFRDADHQWKVLNGEVGEALLKELEKNGLVGLAYYDSGSRHFYNSKREVKTPADMKGLKIRVQQSKLMMSLVKSLGASATPMAYGEVFSSLQSGVIDGAENNWPSYYSTSHFEVASFITLDAHSRTPEILLVSKKVWDKFSADDQKIIKQAALESQKTQRDAWKKYEEKSISEIKKGGKVKITEIKDVAAWQEAVKPVYKEINLGPKKDEYIKKIANVK